MWCTVAVCWLVTPRLATQPVHRASPWPPRSSQCCCIILSYIGGLYNEAHAPVQRVKLRALKRYTQVLAIKLPHLLITVAFVASSPSTSFSVRHIRDSRLSEGTEEMKGNKWVCSDPFVGSLESFSPETTQWDTYEPIFWSFSRASNIRGAGHKTAPESYLLVEAFLLCFILESGKLSAKIPSLRRWKFHRCKK